MPTPKGYRGPPTRCHECGGVYPRADFRKLHYQRKENPYDTRCRSCQLGEHDTTPGVKGSPCDVAERAICRAYGLPAERWRNDPTSPLVVLHYALMVEETNRRYPRKPIRAHPAWTKGAALRLCLKAGLTMVRPLVWPPHTTTTAREGEADGHAGDCAAA